MTADQHIVEALIQDILAQFNAGDVQGALNALQDALKDHPDYADLYHLASKVFEQGGDTVAALEMLERATQQADANPRYFIELCDKYINADRLDDAEQACRTFIERSPKAGVGYSTLAHLLERKGDKDGAFKVLQTGFENADDDEAKVVILNELGIAFRRQERNAEAIEAFENVLRINERVPPVLYNLANTYMDEGLVDKAIRHYQHALDINNDLPDTHLHLGFAYLLKGNLRRGWREMEWRWKIPVFEKTQLDTPRWNGEKTDGTVLLLSEQGMGDSVHFVRYAAQVAERAGKVVVYCPPALARLMASAPGVDDVHTWDKPIPAHESWVPMMSLPGVFRTEMHTIPADVPYLSATAEDVSAWAEKLAHIKGPKVGISWKGNPKNDRERTRAIATAAVVEMVRACNAGFICLHKDRPDDIEDWPANLHHFGDDYTDVADAAALMENLDLVLSIDTLATHLAGALNKELWILLAPVADWRYLLERDDNPWYPSARVLRRTDEEDWSAFTARVAQNLKTRFGDV